MLSEFALPRWAKNEKGNNLFQEAVAAGAIPNSLLFESSATTFLKKKTEFAGDNAAARNIKSSQEIQLI